MIQWREIIHGIIFVAEVIGINGCGQTEWRNEFHLLHCMVMHSVCIVF